MMFRFFFIISILLFFQSCQVSEEVTASKEIDHDLFPGSTLQLILPEDGWKKLADDIDIKLQFPLPVTVTGAPYIEAQIGDSLGFSNNCFPKSHCDASQSKGVKSIEFNPGLYYPSETPKLTSGSFTLSTALGTQTIAFGVSDGISTICKNCTGEEMASELAQIINAGFNPIFSGLTAEAESNKITFFNTKRFYYESGSGTGELIFRYTVTSEDFDDDGLTLNSSIILNGGSLTYTPSIALINDVPTSLVVPESIIKIDGIAPTLSVVTGPAQRTYSTGQNLKYRFTFSEPMIVSGSPSLDINLNSTVQATYKSGSFSKILEFGRVIKNTDIDSDGTFTSGSLLNLSTTDTITDLAGNPIDPTVWPVTTTNSLINVNQPIVQSVTTTTMPGTYGLGQTITFNVTYSQAVTVDISAGAPAIPIKLQTGTVYANYAGGSGTTTLIFTYNILTNHVDLDGITVASPILLNGSSIKQTTSPFTQGSLTFSAPATTTILVDASTGPHVIAVSQSADKVYKEGEEIFFTLNFNSSVNVLGAPQLPITVGATSANAVYDSGSPGSSIVFKYTVQAGEEDLNGISLGGTIDFSSPGSSIKSSAPKDVIPNFSTPLTTGLLVDGTDPTILSISHTGADFLVENQYIYVSVKFSETVTIDEALPPTLSTDLGTGIYLSGTGTNTLVFYYQIASGDLDNDNVLISAINLPVGGHIRDLRSHDANLVSVLLPYDTGIKVDAVAPIITLVTPPATNTYRMMEVASGCTAMTCLDFTLTWSEDVFVTGTPKIQLSFLPSLVNVVATYMPGLSTATSSVFRYVIKNGDEAPMGISTTGLISGSGVFRDETGNPADISSFSSLSMLGVVVDGVLPVVSSITPPSNGVYGIGTDIDLILNWSEQVTAPVTAGVDYPYLKMTVGSSVVEVQLQSSVTNNLTTTLRYTVLSGDLDTNGVSILPALFLKALGEIKDQAGNNAYLNLNTLPDLSAVTVDGVQPTISKIIPPADKSSYMYGENIDFQIVWTEPVKITGTPRILLTVGTDQIYATYEPTASTCVAAYCNTSVFRYTVGLDESDANGIHIGTISDLGSSTYDIDLNGATIEDEGLNDADLTFNIPVLTGVRVDGITAVIDPVSPITMLTTSGTYTTGNTITFRVNWSKAVDVVAPTIQINIGGSFYTATYVSGSGTSSIEFSYTIVSGLLDTDGIEVHSPVSGVVTYDYLMLTYAAEKTFSNPSSIEYPGILVDSKAPILNSITSSNPTDSNRNGIFRPGEDIQYTLVFDENVTVTGAPTIQVNIDSTTVTANYDSGSGTNTLIFIATVPLLNTALDLNGVELVSPMTLAADEIEDTWGNDYAGSLTFSEIDYVYFSNMMARFHIEGNDYSGATCNGTDICITKLNDITGNGHELVPAAGKDGPKVFTGFGGNSTKAMQFDNLSLIKLADDNDLIGVQYILIVMKTVSDASTTVALSNHNLLNLRNSGGIFTRAIEFTSDVSTKSVLLNPAQQIKKNTDSFAGFVTSQSSPTYWSASTDYIFAFEMNAPTDLYAGSFFGGMDFNGQIAEIIFLDDSDSTMTEAQINQIRDQLETIHDTY